MTNNKDQPSGGMELKPRYKVNVYNDGGIEVRDTEDRDNLLAGSVIAHLLNTRPQESGETMKLLAYDLAGMKELQLENAQLKQELEEANEELNEKHDEYIGLEQSYENQANEKEELQAELDKYKWIDVSEEPEQITKEYYVWWGGCERRLWWGFHDGVWRFEEIAGLDLITHYRYVPDPPQDKEKK